MRERFVKEPGSPVCHGVDDPTMLLYGPGPPDDVRLPLELGGHIEDVEGYFIGPCPHCSKEVRHLKLKTVYVAECIKFFWYRPKKQ